MAAGHLSEDRGPVVLAVTTAMMAAATIFVFFRLVSRKGIVKRVTLDDYFIVLAWVIDFGLSFAICYSVKFGLGKHQATIDMANIGSLERLEYVFSVLYNPALMATKTSILLFLLSHFKTDRVLRWSTIITLAVVNVAGIALTFLNIFQCNPMSALFAAKRPESAHCTDIITLYLSSAPVNIITDLAILLLPMPVLRKMTLPRKTKIILHITFGFGVFVTAVDVVRISYLQRATETELRIHGHDPTGQREEQETDFSWYASLSFMWSAIEVSVGIMCACVPPLKPLVVKFIPNLLRDSGESTPEKPGSITTMDTTDAAAAERVPSTQFTPVTPVPPARLQIPEADDDETEMGFLEFLRSQSASDNSPGVLGRSQTAMTNTSRHTRLAGTPTFFDFVTMNSQKSLVHMTNRESIRPIAEVTVLFFLWGFAYGLLNTLNSKFEQVAHFSSGQSVGLHSAYFAGYFVAPITFGRIILNRKGFKACYMVGLVIYGTGTLVFWPSAVLRSFVAFLFSNFIVGMGLSTLEIAANPFIILCGPPEYGEIRLNLSQGVQAIGTLVSPLLAEKALFNDVLQADSLVDVQWAYLAISLFTYILAFVYYCLKVPEVSDEELDELAKRTHYDILPQLQENKIIFITLGLAIFAQFCYLGSQESLSTSLETYIQIVNPGADPTNYEAVGHALFAASRFLAAIVGFFIKPRFLLLFFFIGSIVFSILAMNFSGSTACIMIMGIYFFEGPLFALIFAIPLRALGRHTRNGSACLTAAISGGAIFPAIQYVVAGSTGLHIQYSFCVTVATFAFGTLFPLYLNATPLAKEQVDPIKIGSVRHHTEGKSNSFTRKIASMGHFKRRPGLPTVENSTTLEYTTTPPESYNETKSHG